MAELKPYIINKDTGRFGAGKYRVHTRNGRTFIGDVQRITYETMTVWDSNSFIDGHWKDLPQCDTRAEAALQLWEEFRAYEHHDQI